MTGRSFGSPSTDRRTVDWRVVLAVAVILVSLALVLAFPDAFPLTFAWAAAIASAAVATPRTTLLIALLATAVSLTAYGVNGDLGFPIFWLRLVGFAILVAVAVGISRQRLRVLAALRAQASTDPLTGLANRRLLVERLDAQLRLRGRDHHAAVVYADLDGFKSVNDSLGHSQGDEVLIQASQRLLSCVRAADTVARVGGDEFVIALPEVDGVHEARQVCVRILDAFSVPFRTAGGEARVGITLGVAVTAQIAATPRALVDTADQALIACKAAAAGTYNLQVI